MRPARNSLGPLALFGLRGSSAARGPLSFLLDTGESGLVPQLRPILAPRSEGCNGLTGLVRKRWKSLRGGAEIWWGGWLERPRPSPPPTLFFCKC